MRKDFRSRRGTIATLVALVVLPGLVTEACLGTGVVRSQGDDALPDGFVRLGDAIPTIGNSPATAARQLDYAFASRGFHESVTVRAINSVEEWGASDHCRLLIEVGGE